MLVDPRRNLMRAEQVAVRHAPPLTAPPYPLRSNRFFDREYLNISYRTDPGALRAAPLSDLPVLEIVDASHILTYLTLKPATPIYDYLEAGE
jgi:acetoacetate decarboxylase